MRLGRSFIGICFPIKRLPYLFVATLWFKFQLLVHGIDNRGAVGEELPDGLGTAGWAKREHSAPHHIHSGNTNFMEICFPSGLISALILREKKGFTELASALCEYCFFSGGNIINWFNQLSISCIIESCVWTVEGHSRWRIPPAYDPTR